MNAPQKVTEQVKKLYEDEGWTMVGDVTYDADTSEDLRRWSAEYVSDCRLRVLRHLPKIGDRLMDMASGPIQYPEYLKYSEGFRTRVCVDLSQRALDMAKSKLGARGEYLAGDFLGLTVEPVDAAISLHTIYHMHKDSQEAAVRKLVAVTKPGGTVVIVYSNPAYIVSVVFSGLRKLVNALLRRTTTGDTSDSIYFYRYPLGWWSRFKDVGAVTIYPWRTFFTRDQKALFPNNRLGARLLSALFKWEDRFPRFFTAIGCYPMIVIEKAKISGADAAS